MKVASPSVNFVLKKEPIQKVFKLTNYDGPEE